MGKKLTPAMERALGKLTNEWQDRWDMNVLECTLDALVRRGLAEVIEYKIRLSHYQIKKYRKAQAAEEDGEDG